MANNFFTICSFFYSLMLSIIYFKRKHVGNLETKIYSYLVTTNLLNVIFAILCYFTIINMNSLSILNDFVSKTLLLLFITWELFFTCYIIVITRKIDTKEIKEKFKKSRLLIILSYLVITFFVYMLPLYYHNTNKIVYSYGPSANFIYVLTAILILYWLILIFKNYSILKTKKCIPIILFIILTLIVVVIQKMNPGLLLITATETFITVLMYFTIENPDVKMLSELNKSKEISDNANEEKAMFLYNMTNDIRHATKEVDNIANEILYETENKKVDIERVKDYARELKNSAARFNTMTNEILDISQVDSANIRVYNEKYNVKLIIKEFVGIYKKKCIDKNLDFRTSIASDIPDYLYGDSVGLKNVLSIILDNSIKYTNDGYIEFSVNTIMRRDVCRLIISIEDTGSGIKAENLEKIFSKKEEDTEQDRHNLDNNLYNAKRLITLMGGTIIPTSVYDKGTTIKIVIDQKIVTDTENEITKYEEVYDKKKILLVDDNESSTKIVSKLLEDTNIELEIVSLGSECLDKIRNKEKYDLILLDEDMKPLDGITVMKKLKSIRSFNTNVVLLTRNNDYEYNDDYLKYGFSDYILKPLEKDKFLEKIDKCLK